MLAAGQDWTVDLAPMHWRPNPQLLHESDRARLEATNDDIRQRYGIELGRFLKILEDAGFTYDVIAELPDTRPFTETFQDVMIYASRPKRKK